MIYFFLDLLHCTSCFARVITVDISPSVVVSFCNLTLYAFFIYRQLYTFRRPLWIKFGVGDNNIYVPACMVGDLTPWCLQHQSVCETTHQTRRDIM